MEALQERFEPPIEEARALLNVGAEDAALARAAALARGGCSALAYPDEGARLAGVSALRQGLEPRPELLRQLRGLVAQVVAGVEAAERPLLALLAWYHLASGDAPPLDRRTLRSLPTRLVRGVQHMRWAAQARADGAEAPSAVNALRANVCWMVDDRARRLLREWGELQDPEAVLQEGHLAALEALRRCCGREFVPRLSHSADPIAAYAMRGAHRAMENAVRASELRQRRHALWEDEEKLREEADPGSSSEPREAEARALLWEALTRLSKSPTRGKAARCLMEQLSEGPQEARPRSPQERKLAERGRCYLEESFLEDPALHGLLEGVGGGRKALGALLVLHGCLRRGLRAPSARRLEARLAPLGLRPSHSAALVGVLLAWASLEQAVEAAPRVALLGCAESADPQERALLSAFVGAWEGGRRRFSGPGPLARLAWDEQTCAWAQGVLARVEARLRAEPVRRAPPTRLWVALALLQARAARGEVLAHAGWLRLTWAAVEPKRALKARARRRARAPSAERAARRARLRGLGGRKRRGWRLKGLGDLGG